MNIAAIDRSLGLAGALLAVVVLAGCAAAGGNSGETTTTHDFTFVVTPVPATGSPTNIDVQPITPGDGMYGGGNARIESKSSRVKNVVIWKSSSPFWIRFEGMKSNNGNGGNRFGPADFTRAKDDGAAPYKYYFDQALPSGGGRTESAKYFLTYAVVDPDHPRTAPGFVLDPVIIVDR